MKIEFKNNINNILIKYQIYFFNLIPIVYYVIKRLISIIKENKFIKNIL